MAEVIWVCGNDDEVVDKFEQIAQTCDAVEGAKKPQNKNRSRGYYRRVRVKAIARKRRKTLARGFEWYPVKGKYSKGKIHCSCPMCSAKTNRHDKKYGYKASDRRKLGSLDYSEE